MYWIWPARAGLTRSSRSLPRPLLSVDLLRAGWETGVAEMGAITAVGEPVVDPPQAGVVIVRLPLVGDRGAVTLMISVAKGGYLVGIQMAPAAAASPLEPWAPPSYADPDAFDEQEEEISVGGWSVGGTLSVPRRSGPVPAVVLMAGSGPLDRDETLGATNPSRMWPGDLPAVEWPCCVSTR